MVALSELSTELMRLILEKLDVDFAPRITLRNASLVCRKWHDIALPLLFKTIVLEAKGSRDEKTTAFFEFLFAREDVRQSVKEVVVPVPYIVVTVEFQKALERLLPLLPILDTVRFGGDSMLLLQTGRCEDSDDEDEDHVETTFINEFRASMLRFVNDLKTPPVSAVVEHYVQTLDAELNLQSLTCLESLDATLVNMANSPQACSGMPSQYLAEILSHSPKLQHFQLNLTGKLDMGANHSRYQDEQRSALERLVPNLPNLKSLGLADDFVLSDDAWHEWSKQVDWNKLECLSLQSPTLVAQFTQRLQATPLPHLRTLKLNLYAGGPWAPSESRFPQAPASLQPFLAAQPALEELSLWGLEPGALLEHAGGAHGARLRRLRLHVKESRAERFRTPGPMYDELLLSAVQIARLRQCCPHLEWVGLDVRREELPTAKGEAELALLDALAGLASLQHVRFFVHYSRETEDVRDADVVAAFEHLRSRKQGCPLESAVVCWDHGLYGGVWLAWDLGKGKAGLEFRRIFQPRTVSIWDTAAKVKRDEQVFEETGHGSPTDVPLGIPEGW